MKLPDGRPVVVDMTREYLERVESLLTTLTKNAAHCFGVDFYDLNEALIETSQRLNDLRIASYYADRADGEHAAKAP